MKPNIILYRYLLLCSLNFWAWAGHAQSEAVRIAEVKEMTKKSNDALANNNPELAIIHGIEAVNHSIWANHELTAKAMLALAKGYYAKQDYNNALDFAVQTLTILNQTADDLDKTEAQSLLGDVYLAWKIPSKAIEHLEEAYQLEQAARTGFSFRTIERLAQAYLMANNQQRATIFFKMLQEEGKKQNKLKVVAEASHQLALLYVSNKEYTTAITHSLVYAEALSIQKAAVKKQALAMQDIGFIYRQLKEYPASIEWMHKATNLHKTPEILNNLGVSYISNKNYIEAKRVLEESLTLCQQQQDLAGEAQAYTYLAANEHVQGKHQEALELVSEAVTIARQDNIPLALADAYLLQSEVYAAMGDFRRSQEAYKLNAEINQQLEKNKQQEKELAQQRAIIAQEQETQSRMMVSDKEKQLLQLGQAQLEAEKQAKELVLLTQEKQLQDSKLKNEALEKERAEQALAITKAQLRALKKEKEASQLARESEKQELIIKQKELEEREKQIQLSLLTKENSALEQKRQQQENEIAQQEETLEKDRVRQQQSYAIIALVSLLLLLAIAGFVWSIRQRRRISAQKQELEAQKEVLEVQQGMIMEKNEELQASEEEIRQNSEELLSINEQMQTTMVELQKQKSLVDKKNSNITSSINYARRIQQAILPTDAAIHSALPNSFVFYLPKDIVSGDFYWFFNSDTHLYIAAVDCTGHGVPGAFMSLIGHSLLRETVVDKQLTDPSKILDAMHVGIMNGLRQYEDDSDSKDGMDASLCVIDKANKKLLFAGAHNPLVYIQDGELHEIKGDRYSIGGRKKLYAEHFQTNEIALSDNTCCYLFSDGFQDQFGGPKGRKFMRKQLKEKLLAIHSLPMKEQGDLMEQEFYQWMGHEKQLDDVLLIGFQWN